MRYIFMFSPIALFAIIFGAFRVFMTEETTASCCSLSQFAALSANQQFRNAHEEPLAYTHLSAAGKMVTFKTADGKKAYAFEIKAAKKTNNWVFVFHEWWGLNDHIKRETERYYTDLGNVNVLAIDLYDGTVATTREEAGKAMQDNKKERSESIVKGAYQYAGKKAKVGTVGWCFGGSWSLQASLLGGKQAAACVIYYGMPEKDVEKLKTLQPDVLGIFAGKEQWISPKIVAEFEENMKKAGKTVSIKNYDADHAFANPSNAKYNKEFADEAYKHALTFFKEKLQ